MSAVLIGVELFLNVGSQCQHFEADTRIGHKMVRCARRHVFLTSSLTPLYCKVRLISSNYGLRSHSKS